MMPMVLSTSGARCDAYNSSIIMLLRWLQAGVVGVRKHTQVETVVCCRPLLPQRGGSFYYRFTVLERQYRQPGSQNGVVRRISVMVTFPSLRGKTQSRSL